MTHFDLIVIGAGSGGLAAAKNAAKLGQNVAIIEGSRVGGTCVIRGCVPKKIMSFAAQISDTFEDSKGYFFDVQKATFDFKAFVEKRNAEIDRLNEMHLTFLAKAEVTLVEGFAKFVSDTEITVDDKQYTADRFIISTGSTPFMPPIPGTEHAITSDGIWDMTEFPKHMTIVGGGYIALEFASIFNSLGADVHVVIRKNKVLTGFDNTTRKFLQAELVKRGINFHLEAEVTGITLDGERKAVALTTGETLSTNVICFATGRIPLVGSLGLENTGVALAQNKSVIVDDRLKTAVDTIYAVGDVINRVNLTPVAIKHGRMVTNNIYGGHNLTVDDAYPPTAVFTNPPVGTVGLTEQQAIEQYGVDAIYTYKADFKPMMYSFSGRDERMLMTMVTEMTTDIVLGIHIVGRDSAEMIQGFGVAVKAGLTKADFDATIAVHPSSSEELVLMTH